MNNTCTSREIALKHNVNISRRESTKFIKTEQLKKKSTPPLMLMAVELPNFNSIHYSSEKQRVRTD